MARLLDLKRNDEPAALEIASAAIEAGEFTPELVEVLLMLQDDPADLIDALDVLHQAQGS